MSRHLFNAVTSDSPSYGSGFRDSGYVILRSVVDGTLLKAYMLYALSYVRLGRYFGYEEENHAIGRYADGMGEAMLMLLKPTVEQFTRCALSPAYSYLRIYTPESRLERHTDRGACEVSVTLPVGSNIIRRWGIYLNVEGEDRKVDLEVGDALIYEGMKLEHWRDRLPEGYWCQLFLHYVRSEGRFAEHVYDGREHIGPWHGSHTKK